MSDVPDARAIRQYFESLDRCEFERAADQFTEDVTYIHPPTYSDETTISSRDALYTYFTETRGEQPLDHHIERTLVGDGTCAAVGYTTEPDGSDPQEYFVAYAEFDGKRIDYYIAGLLGMA